MITFNIDLRFPFRCSFFSLFCLFSFFFFFNDTATTEIYTLSLHDALPIEPHAGLVGADRDGLNRGCDLRSEEHTSELQSRLHLVCRLLLEKKKKQKIQKITKKIRKNRKNIYTY